MNPQAPNETYMSTIAAMYGAHSPWRAPEFPLVYPTKDHTVLYQITTQGFGKPPQALAGHDKWDNNHVKMPTSDKSMYDVTKMVVLTNTENRWKIIEKALKKSIKDSDDLAKTILKYNTKFADTWHFASMHKFFNQYWDRGESKDFFKNTLPSIAGLAVDLPKLIQAPIPMLKKETNHSISLSQLQIASLLANAFFCTFPRRNTTSPGSEYGEYPRINFTSLYNSDAEGIMEKLKCVCHYFKRVCNEMPTGVLTFSRRSVHRGSCPNWEHSKVPVGSVPFHVNQHVNIEDADGMIQVDFANKYLGGGVLGGGLVQEEIRFMICPELMVGMLFTEKLGPYDALMTLGCERYSNYTGYGRVNFRWASDYRDQTPLDGSGRRRCAVVAIDAQNFHDERRQYQKDMIYRELNKAYIGFSFFTDKSSPGLQYPGVATGSWGCGAFKGDPQLKALIQLMACAHARRPIAYFTFNDARVKDEILSMFNMLKQHNTTVGDLFKFITWYHQTDFRNDLNYLVRYFVDTKNKPPALAPPGRPGHQTTYQNTYNTSNQYGSPTTYPTAYSSTPQVPANGGRGQRNRASAPVQTVSRPDSPPSVSSSPSYSDVCPGRTIPSSIGRQHHNTDPSSDSSTRQTKKNLQVQGYNHGQSDQNYAQQFGTRNEEDGERANSNQRNPSLNLIDLLTDESSTDSEHCRGPPGDQPHPPGFKALRDKFEPKAQGYAPGTEDRSGCCPSYENQREPPKYSDVKPTRGADNANQYNDQQNREPHLSGNKSSKASAVAPLFSYDDKHQPRTDVPEPSMWQDKAKSKFNQPTSASHSDHSASHFKHNDPQQTRNVGSSQTAWKPPTTSAHLSAFPQLSPPATRPVPMDIQQWNQSSSQSAWQNNSTSTTQPVPMETDTSSKSSDAGAQSQGVNQKVDNPSSHLENSYHEQSTHPQDVAKLQQALMPSPSDDEMADDSVKNVITTPL